MQFEAVLPIKVGATADRVGIEGGTGEVGIGLGLVAATYPAAAPVIVHR